MRVDVLRAPSEERSFKSSELRVETRPLDGRLEIHMLHLESMVSVRACSADPPEKARPFLESFLRARIAGAAAMPGGPAIVRRYRLGPAPLVRDRRTGRTTGRLDRVLKGDLDAFLVP